MEHDNICQKIANTAPIHKIDAIKQTNQILDIKYKNKYIVCVDSIINNEYYRGIIEDIFLGKDCEIIEIDYNNMLVGDIIYYINNSILFVSDCLPVGLWFDAKNILVTNTEKQRCKYNINNATIYTIDENNGMSIPIFRNNFITRNNLRLHNKTSRMPFVSCVCPTYNRTNFLPILIKCFHSQTYPKDYRELIILDDSDKSNIDVINNNNPYNNIKYIHYKKKITIGKKRNLLNQLITGDYVVCFDDDDYYPTCRVTHAVNSMISHKINLCGSSSIFVYYTDLKKIYQFGPYGQNHATNGTLAYHRNYLINNVYDDNSKLAEEITFLNNHTSKLVQLNPYFTIVCIAHNSNTFDKKQVINSGKKMDIKLDGLVKDKNICNWYRNIAQ